MDRFRRFRRRWEVVPEDVIGTFLLAAVFFVMVAGVFFRYVLNDSLIWTEELARYGLILMTFVGIATGFRSRTHVRIDLIDRAPPALAGAARRIVWVLSALFLGFLVAQAIGLAQVLRASRSAALNLPVSWLYYAVTATLVLGLARLLLVGIAGLRQGRR